MSFEPNDLFVSDALILLERLRSKTVTLVYLDPPRNMGMELNEKKSKFREQSEKEYASYLSKVAQHLHRILKDNGSLFVHSSNAFTIDLRLLLNQIFSERQKYEITWHV